MNNTATENPEAAGFVRHPGQGFVFWRVTHDDARTVKEKKAAAAKQPVHTTSVWSGWLMLPGNHEVQVRAIASTREKGWRFAIHEFGGKEQPEDDWKKLSEFALPAFGDFAYQDSEFKLGTRTYKIRVMRTPEGRLRLRLPQVGSPVKANSAIV